MPSLKHFIVLPAVLLTALLLSACNSMPQPIKNLGKSDIDFVTDAHVQEQLVLIENLIRKLYVRNPRELSKAPSPTTIEERITRLLGDKKTGTLPELDFAELDGKQSIDAFYLGLDPSWQGDRVFAVAAGLTGMLKKSYNSKTDFYYLDSLNQQDLYNSARNIEILNWKLSNSFDANGNLLLLSDHIAADHTDISFDRIFTRMTALQDMMASIVSSSNDRGINFVVLGVAQSFFPVGI